MLLDATPVAETGSLATALAAASTRMLRSLAHRPETRWGGHRPGEWRLDTRAAGSDAWVWSGYSIVEVPVPATARDLPALADALDAAHVRLKAEVEPRLLAGALAEQRHLLHDADPDAATPALPCPTDARRQS